MTLLIIVAVVARSLNKWALPVEKHLIFGSKAVFPYIHHVSLTVPPVGCLQDIQHLSPATDFYKKLALDCSGQQVAVDLFLLSAQYCDLASLGKFQME